MHKACLINLPTQPKSHINLRDALRGPGGGGKNKRMGKPTVEQARGEQGRHREALKAQARPQSLQHKTVTATRRRSTKTTRGRWQQFLTAASWAGISTCGTAQNTGQAERSCTHAPGAALPPAGPATASGGPQLPSRGAFPHPGVESEFPCRWYKIHRAGSGSNMGPGSQTKPLQLLQNSQNPGASRAGRDPQGVDPALIPPCAWALPIPWGAFQCPPPSALPHCKVWSFALDRVLTAAPFLPWHRHQQLCWHCYPWNSLGSGMDAENDEYLVPIHLLQKQPIIKQVTPLQTSIK